MRKVVDISWNSLSVVFRWCLAQFLGRVALAHSSRKRSGATIAVVMFSSNVGRRLEMHDLSSPFRQGDDRKQSKLHLDGSQHWRCASCDRFWSEQEIAWGAQAVPVCRRCCGEPLQTPRCFRTPSASASRAMTPRHQSASPRAMTAQLASPRGALPPVQSRHRMPSARPEASQSAGRRCTPRSTTRPATSWIAARGPAAERAAILTRSSLWDERPLSRFGQVRAPRSTSREAPERVFTRERTSRASPSRVSPRIGSAAQYEPRAGTRQPTDGGFEPKLDREMMRKYLAETNMTRTELYRLFNRFKALCKLSGTPGSINRATFKEGVSSLAFEDDTFVNRVFSLLDEDGSGTVEWAEFVNAVNALETGSPHDKLQFCFKVYDRDGSGSIERAELQHMFMSMMMYDTNGEARDGPKAPQKADIASMSPALKELIDDFVNSIYDSFDADRNGSLDFEEVLEAVQANKVADVWEVFGRALVSKI